MPYIPSWERIAEERAEKRAEERTEKRVKKTTAIGLLKEGVDKKIIANVTGFPLRKIEELAVEAH